jgi:hypothetical protein
VSGFPIYIHTILLYNIGDIPINLSFERMMQVKYRLIGVLILSGTLVLLVTLPGFTNAVSPTPKPKKIIAEVKQNAKNVKQSTVKGFKNAKTKIKQDTKTVKKKVVNGFKNTKTKTKQTVKTVKKKIVKDFKNAKTKTKQTVTTVKKKIVNGFKGLKTN